MRAISKTSAAPGIALTDVPEPKIRPGCVKLRVHSGSVCGTDLHIYNWDAFSKSRIHPPRIIGHEFCGEIIEVGEGVSADRLGQFVSSESHIVCGTCARCRVGEGHICLNTKILGIDVDGGFADYAVIPSDNARPVPQGLSSDIAAMLDALGNGVHTVCAGPVEGQTVLITGLGPIGLFAVAICKALGAKQVIATEIKARRKEIARTLGVDVLIDPTEEDASAKIASVAPGGVDATLEMSGHPSAIRLAMDHTRPGGRVSLLGLYPEETEPVPMNTLVMKGLQVQGIVGRRLWETWDTMKWLIEEKGLDVSPVVTDRVNYQEAEHGFEILKAGTAGKVVIDFLN